VALITGASSEAADLVRAMGLDPDTVAEVDIHMEPSAVVTVRVLHYLDREHALQMTKRLSQYELKQKMERWPF